MSGLEIFSIISGLLTLGAFIFSIYQHFKLKSLREGVDSIDRICKTAKLECARLENGAKDEAEKSKIRVLSGLIASLLNITTTRMSYDRKSFEKGGNQAPFIDIE